MSQPSYQGPGVLRGRLKEIAENTLLPIGLRKGDLDLEAVFAEVHWSPEYLAHGFVPGSKCPLRIFLKRFESSVRAEAVSLEGPKQIEFVADLIRLCGAFFDFSEDGWVREEVEDAIRNSSFTLVRSAEASDAVERLRSFEFLLIAHPRARALEILANAEGVDLDALRRSLQRAKRIRPPDMRSLWRTAAGRAWFEGLEKRQAVVERRWKRRGRHGAVALVHREGERARLCGCRAGARWQCCGAALCETCLHLHLDGDGVVTWAPKHAPTGPSRRRHGRRAT